VKREFFDSRGRTVQFHPAVTYEDFVVGLSPDPSDAGLRFRAKPGWLLQAAADAHDDPYLLIVDEINRGDLGKVLGEAIYLFEPEEVGGAGAREVHLPHAVDGHSSFRLPPNLFVLGTMNTADRSIAGLDLAVRRRFAFVTLMPDPSVIALQAGREFFEDLMSVFVEHSSDETLHLLPGHSYFLAKNEAHLRDRFRYELLPLIDEYLRQGLLGSASSDLHSVREKVADFAWRRS
jgi:5-methylcytosine-specific restriction protein B